MKKFVIMILTALFAVYSFGKADKKIDPESKLVVDRGLEEVKKNCVVCHTGRFIVKNGGDRKFWNMKIRVMQKGFGLWKLDKKTHELIVEYLSKNYHKKWNVKEKKEEENIALPKLPL